MKSPIIFFDGVCNLCNWFVRILIKIDKKRILRFSSLQSDFAKSIDALKPFIAEPFESVIFYTGDNVYQKSEALIEIFKLMPVPWKYFGIIRLLPENLRNQFYEWIAFKRYQIFGRKGECMLSDSDIKELFLD